MFTVDEATQRIQGQITVLAAEDVPTVQALGRVLAQDSIAASSIPAFANSSMDGYAVRAADVVGAALDSPVALGVRLDIPAGSVPGQALGPMEAARIMTGAPLPNGADAVVPVEHTNDHWMPGDSAMLPERVTIYRAVRVGEYVRPVGEDIRAGQTVLRAGTALRPQDIGVLVSLGYTQVSVVRQPRVAILSTGDELIDVNEPLTPGKIRNSNSYVLAGLVTQCGGIPLRLPIARDTVDDVRRCFQDALAQRPDLIISSAGVSVGARDVVRTVVDDLGKIELWRINLRPGKPLAFGHIQNVSFFGLPGNPVSAMVAFDIFVRPALLMQAGNATHTAPVTQAVLGEEIQSDGRRSYLRVALTEENGELIAHTTGTQSSGALLSMVLADGLLIVPEGVTEVAVGSRLAVRLLRDVNNF